MLDGSGADELRNPRLNPLDNTSEVARRVDEAQGFEVEEPLPGEDDEDEGYELALAGREAGESEDEADILDQADLAGGIGQGFTAGEEGSRDLQSTGEPAFDDGQRVVAAPEDSASR